MSDEETQQKQTRTQRRVLRTRATIEQAFVELILEKGYDKVNVEDITNRADVARATFYAHYPNKEALLASVFSRLMEGLRASISDPEGKCLDVHGSSIDVMCRHAEEMRDLYKACLSDAWARQAYMSAIVQFSETYQRYCLDSNRTSPRIPVHVMARAFAGAHVAILESWLAGEIPVDAKELARIEMDLTTAGWAWGLGMDASDFGYTGGSHLSAATDGGSGGAAPRELS
jgi:AcrR family transcriptional regulator